MGSLVPHLREYQVFIMKRSLFASLITCMAPSCFSKFSWREERSLGRASPLYACLEQSFFSSLWSSTGLSRRGRSVIKRMGLPMLGLGCFSYFAYFYHYWNCWPFNTRRGAWRWRHYPSTILFSLLKHVCACVCVWLYVSVRGCVRFCLFLYVQLCLSVSFLVLMCVSFSAFARSLIKYSRKDGVFATNWDFYIDLCVGEKKREALTRWKMTPHPSLAKWRNFSISFPILFRFVEHFFPLL